MNYYKRHLGDYAKGAGHLSLIEHGAYTVLLDRYYITEQPIPSTEAYRVARARTDDERAAVDAVLQEFFTLTDGAWHHGRCDEELAKYQEKSETNRGVAVAREAAKRASNVARSDHEQTTNRAQNVVESCDEREPKASCVSGEPSHKPLTNNHKEAKAPRAALPDPPSWIDSGAWQGFVEMRKVKRNPLTSRAAELMFAKLDRFRSAGHNPNTLLDTSTRNGWLDVYEPKGDAPRSTQPAIKRRELT